MRDLCGVVDLNEIALVLPNVDPPNIENAGSVKEKEGEKYTVFPFVLHDIEPQNVEMEDDINCEMGKVKAVSEKTTTSIHPMVTRANKEKQRAPQLLSPYYDRQVGVTEKLSLEEKQIFYWLLTAKHEDENRIVYSDNLVTIFVLEFRRFASYKNISAGIIDAWSSYLNKIEDFRSPNSPYRFYFTTIPCSSIVDDVQEACESEKMEMKFNESLDIELNEANNPNLANIDMVFFPICRLEHLYVVCINFQLNKIVILDSTIDVDTDDVAAKYRDVPNKLAIMFRRYLCTKQFYSKLKAILGVRVESLQLKWRDVKNNVDCGIYTMRHMECYKGQTTKSWTIGLKKNPWRQLKFLRAKYCKILLKSEWNDVDDVVPDAEKHFDESVASGTLDVGKMLENYMEEDVEAAL